MISSLIRGIEQLFWNGLDPEDQRILLHYDLSSALAAIRQYREFTEPFKEGWHDHCLSIFHILGFQTKQQFAERYSLHSPDHPAIEITLDISGNEQLGIPKGTSETTKGWRIKTNGIQLRASFVKSTGFERTVIILELEDLIAKSDKQDFTVFVLTLNKICRMPNFKYKDNTILPEYAFVPFAKEFRSIRQFTDKRAYDERTNFQAPHKNFLLLAVIDGFIRGRYRDGRIHITQELINSVFDYWREILNVQASIHHFVYPFFYSRRSSFWNLNPRYGKETELENKKDINSMNQLVDLVAYAQLDPDLILTLNNIHYLEALVEIIIDHNFDEETADVIRLFRNQKVL